MLMCFRVTTIAVEKEYVLNILSVFIVLGIRHAMRVRHIVICDLPGSAIFCHIISYTASLKKKSVTDHKMCVLIFSTTFD
jgi:hypothetical protein